MQDLKNWIIEFLKHKDIFTKSLVAIKEKRHDVLVTYKDKEILYIVREDLSLAVEEVKDNVCIVTLNTRDNLDILIKHWHQLVKHPELTIYFVNTDSEAEKKWIIRPYLHNKIADEDSLKVGLSSLFAMVDQAA